ncbi:hypothetical protein VKT23_000024 [Stygiomarasmius scandens]|uniref:Uncharacterized protein n=1 Tax=Marasmiellus scandens TaxID=2682957 RepID=A0ABR1K481_9AGAR
MNTNTNAGQLNVASSTTSNFSALATSGPCTGVLNATTETCTPFSIFASSSVSDLMGQVVTIASVLGTQIDQGSTPIPSMDTHNMSIGNGLTIFSTTRQVAITSTVSTQGTDEITIITSTTVEIESARYTTNLEGSGATVSTNQGGSTSVMNRSLSNTSTDATNKTGINFWNNKPAVIGTFAVIGMITLSLIAFLIMRRWPTQHVDIKYETAENQD